MTNIADQYRTITSQAGWTDRGARGRLKFVGSDGLPFLQRLLTNDVAHLEPGRGVYAAWLTPLGRMVADIDVLHRGDHLLGLVGDGLGAALAARFENLLFSEDLAISDVSEAFGEIAVTGADAAGITAAALGIDAGGPCRPAGTGASHRRRRLRRAGR